jgi:hypothetical protein
MRNPFIASSLSLAVTLTACASRPDNIQAKYVSPITYSAWSCDQLADEDHRVQSEVIRVSDIQRGNANADTAMVVGSIFLWPVLIGLAATTDHKDEVARLKGEYDAVEQEQKIKSCTVAPPPAPAIHT